MQNTLLKKQKTPVELKESYGGFEVCNSKHIDYKDVEPKFVRSGEMIVKQYPSYEIAKEEFEKEIKRNYQADVVWLKSKFQDSEGVFWLDGVKVKWELKTFYIGEYHFEFTSEQPNLLTETGYRSHFPIGLDSYPSIKEHLKDYIEYTINGERKKKKLKKMIEYRLDWKNTGYNPKKQFTLIELKGGKGKG